MTLYKYCANGNDFLIFHTLYTQGDYATLARKMCDRHSGIGADGLVALLPYANTHDNQAIAYQWDFYNADGSRANMCGNASRCVAHYAYHQGLAPKAHSFITHSSMQARVIDVRVQGAIVSSNLGSYRNLFALSALPSDLAQKLESSGAKHLAPTLLDAARWHYIDTGVPHLVCFVQDLATITESISAIKPFMQELRKVFDANVNIAYAKSSDEIYLATYERGVEDITLACGTGMAAVLLVGHKVWGLESSAVMVPPSGDRLKLWCLATGDSALGSHSRGSFLAKNGDCSGESAVTYDQVCALDSPCKAPFLSQKSFREQVVPENKYSPTAKRSFFRKQATAVQGEAAAGFFRTPRILENAGQTKKLDSSFAPSSRADEIGVAIHNSAPAESINQSRGTRNLESVQGVWGFKGDKGERFASSPPVPLEENLSQTTLESSKKAQKVDSSARVDCHEVVPTSRNDRNNSALGCHADKTARNDNILDSSGKIPTLAHISELESKSYTGDEEVFLEGEVRCIAVCQTCYDS